MTYKAWEALVGSWAKDAEDAKLKDPSLDAAITGQSTSLLSWQKILRVGLKGYIKECQEHIDAYIAAGGTDIDKIYFWQSAVIVLQAVIDHAGATRTSQRRWRRRRRTQRKGAPSQNRRDVPVCPRQSRPTMREALQSMQFCNLAKMLENPIQEQSLPLGPAPTGYLYAYFRSDLERGVPIGDLPLVLADLIGRWGAQTFVAAGTQRLSHQINYGINNVMLGGLGIDGEDQSNELSYLFCTLSLLHLSSPPLVCGGTKRRRSG